MREILPEQNFKKHKDKTLYVYDKYMSFNPYKANEILDCGQSLWFLLKEHVKTKERALKLDKMYTCKDRFCPFCNWRRQMKYSKLIYTHLMALQGVRFIFLTLTVKNCNISDLRETIKQMNDAFKRLQQSKRWKNSILGYLKVLEFTIQKDDEDMIHPHFHILLAVQPQYFDTKKNLYLNKNDFATMWKKALRVEYAPVVDVRIVKSNKNKDKNAAAVAELCKYPMKDTDISKLSNGNFKTLTEQLKNIRNISSGGILKGILKSVEKIDDDLIHIDDDMKDDLWIVLKKILFSYENENGNLNYYLKETVDV